MTLYQVVGNLSATGDYQNFTHWFNEYFLPNGLAVTYFDGITSNSGFEQELQADNVTIPLNLNVIAQWISQETDKEVRQRCAICSEAIEGGFIPITNMSTDSEGLVVPSLDNIRVSNYNLPPDCQYQEDDESTDENARVCCQQTGLQACYTLYEINAFVHDNLTTACGYMNNNFETCQGVTQDPYCYPNYVYTSFIFADWQDIYAWLYFDQVLASLVYY